MGIEEQIEERDVLNSIFPDEIQDISESEYRISVNVDAFNQDSDDVEPLQIVLHVKYPLDYPNVPPILDIISVHSQTSHPFFSIAADSASLLDGLTETINENIGMAMIFTLVSVLKENAEKLILNRKQEWQRKREEKLIQVENEENKRFHGTPVTRESFAVWREGFMNEMEQMKRMEEELEEIADKKRGKTKDLTPSLTGKQLWMKGLVNKNDFEEDIFFETDS